MKVNVTVFKDSKVITINKRNGLTIHDNEARPYKDQIRRVYGDAYQILFNTVLEEK